MSKKSKQAGSGAATPPRSADRKSSQAPAEMARERPSASEPSLPDDRMDDPTGRNRPGPVEEPQKPKPSDKIHADTGDDAKDFVAGPQSAPEPEDFVAGPESDSEAEDLVGPQDDAPHAGGPARAQSSGREEERFGQRKEPGRQEDDGGTRSRYDERNSTFSAGTDEVQELFTRFFGGYADFRNATDEAQRVTQATQNACVDGFCALTEEFHALTRDALEKNRETTEAMLSAKSLPEAWEAQYRAMQETLRSYAEHMRRLNAIGLETMQRAAEPVGEQMTQSLNRFWRQQAM